MALELLFFDGFGLSPGSAAKHATKYLQGAPFDIVTGRTASLYAGRLTTLGYLMTRIATITAGKNCFAQFATKYPSGTEAYRLGPMFAVIESISTTHVTIGINADGTISAYRGTTSGTLLGTSTLTIAPDRYYVAQVKVKVHDTTGTVDVRFDGVSYISLTGQDTKNGGSNWNQVALQAYLSGSNLVTFADFCLWQGDAADGWPSLTLRVLTGRPVPDSTAAGAHAAFAPNPGTDHGANVDDVTPDDDATYNSSATPGDRDSYRYDTLPISGATVVALAVVPYVKQTDAGVRTGKSFVRVAGTDYDHPHAIDPITTGYEYVEQQIWELNPATSAAWLESEVNAVAAERGFKIQS